jgi:hypothetical protein
VESLVQLLAMKAERLDSMLMLAPAFTKRRAVGARDIRALCAAGDPVGNYILGEE